MMRLCLPSGNPDGKTLPESRHSLIRLLKKMRLKTLKRMGQKQRASFRLNTEETKNQSVQIGGDC
jgi:hypothetical protein